MILKVECGTGPHGDPEPRAFTLGGHYLEVMQIIDRWPSGDHAYFKLAASDGST